MLVLLPPSEGKTAPLRGKPLDLATLSYPSLTEARSRMLDALVELSDRPDAAEVLGLGHTLVEEVRRNGELREAPTARADRVYSGVLYEALDLGSLDASARRRAGRSLLVASGLFGVLRTGDRIPAYRLSGGVTLPGLGGVASYWRRELDPVLDQAAGQGLVIDLRSTTYAGFWRPEPDLAGRVATVRVLHESGGRRSVVSHLNKATKGRLARALLEDGTEARTPAGLADQLRDLGWTVEPGPLDRAGQRLDVVVAEL